jgi:hypothetical protein
MEAQNFQKKLRVGQIVFGPRQDKRSSITRAGHWIDGINRQSRITSERIEDRAADAFQRQGDWFALKALTDFFQPSMQ